MLAGWCRTSRWLWRCCCRKSERQRQHITFCLRERVWSHNQAWNSQNDWILAPFFSAHKSHNDEMLTTSCMQWLHWGQLSGWRLALGWLFWCKSGLCCSVPLLHRIYLHWGNTGLSWSAEFSAVKSQFKHQNHVLHMLTKSVAFFPTAPLGIWIPCNRFVYLELILTSCLVWSYWGKINGRIFSRNSNFFQSNAKFNVLRMFLRFLRNICWMLRKEPSKSRLTRNLSV